MVRVHGFIFSGASAVHRPAPIVLPDMPPVERQPAPPDKPLPAPVEVKKKKKPKEVEAAQEAKARAAIEAEAKLVVDMDYLVTKLIEEEVARAAEQMRADGFNVLMEGRAQTLDYVRTPHRFELTLSEPNIIGMRRAAQRMMGEAIKALKADVEPTPERVHAVLASALAAMAK